MKKYIVKRLLYLFVVMLGVSLLTFSISQLTPGDPAELILRESGVEPTREAIQALREQLGLNEPLPVQYGKWLWAVLQGDLGQSFRTGQPVLEEIAHRFPATIELTLAGLLVMLVVALPVGILSALFKNTFMDHLSRFFALLGASLPSFWLGLLLIYYFAVKLSILPVMGRGGILHLVLPALTLGLGMSATYARLLRASMLEVLGQDYIHAARARGLKEHTVLVKNALKNALLPVVTAFGMSLGHLLGGTVIVETIFAWPGVGRFVVQAIFNRDYPVIQGYVLFMALIFVLVNLVVDLSYKFIDPRIRLEGGDSS
ncbi:nickel ABC transporter permease [Candidatus Contubernalis alkaliaceticus]|uniref:nickel ABC transporter permease n=1 Tax=Candidatus Contubernalis alkaliaceticus TaxID=338645 RepID=UPI001F4C3F31|nr:nickel ABC transporter permease [Candidatus Contubernalis alkalaceticus]UNC93005.1 ABC transporter permease [Candidatus Contubernalis alkalaceticus]